LITWLLDLALQLDISFKTIIDATVIMDMFMNKETIKHEQLSLVAITALFISIKMEEDNFEMSAKRASQLIDNKYTRLDIIRMEMQMLKAIDYRVNIVTIYDIAMRYDPSLTMQLSLILSYIAGEYYNITEDYIRNIGDKYSTIPGVMRGLLITDVYKLPYGKFTYIKEELQPYDR